MFGRIKSSLSPRTAQGRSSGQFRHVSVLWGLGLWFYEAVNRRPDVRGSRCKGAFGPQPQIHQAVARILARYCNWATPGFASSLQPLGSGLSTQTYGWSLRVLAHQIDRAILNVEQGTERYLEMYPTAHIAQFLLSLVSFTVAAEAFSHADMMSAQALKG